MTSRKQLPDGRWLVHPALAGGYSRAVWDAADDGALSFALPKCFAGGQVAFVDKELVCLIERQEYGRSRIDYLGSPQPEVFEHLGPWYGETIEEQKAQFFLFKAGLPCTLQGVRIGYFRLNLSIEPANNDTVRFAYGLGDMKNPRWMVGLPFSFGEYDLSAWFARDVQFVLGG